MLKTIALIAVAVVVLFLLFVSTRPDTFRVVRSLQIKAAPEKIFPLISNLQQYNTWNPYSKKDANIKLTYSGPPEGVGAKFVFDGNKDAGKGSIEVVNTVVPSQVKMRLVMAEPFPIDNLVSFSVTAKGAESEVSWSMEGPVPFVAKIAHLVMNMDKMIGADFEVGLASLKALAEAR
jgi:hypothetical protein